MIPGLDLSDLKYCVIEPALIVIGHNSMSALNLGTGTALVESACMFLRQKSGGPALGLFQVEPATEQDIWTNYLAYQRDLASRVRSLLAPGPTTPQLITNLAYAAAICRIKYLRAPQPLPEARDAGALSGYHKLIYNTAHGAAEIAANVSSFEAAIAA